jgi:hypothetical protein
VLFKGIDIEEDEGGNIIVSSEKKNSSKAKIEVSK